MTVGKTSARRIEIADDTTRAVNLRRDGHSVREIARRLGCSVGRAHKLVESGIKAAPAEAVEQLRIVEGERLDRDYERLGRLVKAAMPDALTGKATAAETVTKATHERTNISVQRAKLFGLNAKESVDVSGSLALTHDVHDQLLDRLSRLAAAAATGEGDTEPHTGGSAGGDVHVAPVGAPGADGSGDDVG